MHANSDARGPSLLLGRLALGHQRVLLRDVVQHGSLAALLELSRDENLIQHVIGLMEMEDQVQLAHVPKVAVKALHEVVHQLERHELIVLALNPGDEEGWRSAYTRSPM